MPRAEAARIVEQIGAALSYAHTHQVIHGDVRPGNILLDTTQNPVRSVLTDFGRMKELSVTLLKKGDSPGHSPSVPEAHGYIAPEQWEPQSPLIPATDVYGLAITLFEILAGRHPLEEEVLSKLGQKRLHEPLPLLSRVAYKIGPFFDQVLTKATAKDPADRYQRVADFIEDVKAANSNHRGSYPTHQSAHFPSDLGIAN